MPGGLKVRVEDEWKRTGGAVGPVGPTGPPGPAGGVTSVNTRTGAVALVASDITSGTIATARLGSGAASGTTYLRGDQTWAAAETATANPLVFDERDYVSRQAALNAAGAAFGNHPFGGGLVYTPRGDFLIPSMLTVPHGVEWTGVGSRGTRFRPAPGFSDPAMVFMGPAANPAAHGPYGHGMIIRRMELDCNNFVGLHGVISETAQEPAMIDNVLITQYRGYGLRVYVPYGFSAANQFLVQNSEFFHSTQGALSGIEVSGLGLSFVVRRTTFTSYATPVTNPPVLIHASDTKVLLDMVHLENSPVGVHVERGPDARGGLVAIMCSGHPSIGKIFNITDEAPHHLIGIADDGAPITVDPLVGANVTGYVSEFDNTARKYAGRQSNLTIVADGYRFLHPTSGTVLVDATAGNASIQLPQLIFNQGVEFVIKKVDSSVNTVNIYRSGTDTIEGATSKLLTTQYQSFRVIGTNFGWMALS